MQIKQRYIDKSVEVRLVEEGVNPLLARLYAARGVTAKQQLETSLNGIIPPDQLTNNTHMAICNCSK